MGVAKSGRGMRVVELPERKEALEKKKEEKPQFTITVLSVA